MIDNLPEGWTRYRDDPGTIVSPDGKAYIRETVAGVDVAAGFFIAASMENLRLFTAWPGASSLEEAVAAVERGEPIVIARYGDPAWDATRIVPPAGWRFVGVDGIEHVWERPADGYRCICTVECIGDGWPPYYDRDPIEEMKRIDQVEPVEATEGPTATRGTEVEDG